MTLTQGFEMPTQSVFEQQMDELKSDMREMRAAVLEMAKALSKLTVLEERNLITNQAVEKIASRQDKLEDKVGAVELEQARFEATVGGVTKTMKVMWAAFGGGVLYLGAQLIKMATH